MMTTKEIDSLPASRGGRVRTSEKVFAAIFFALLLLFIFSPAAHAAVGDPREIDIGTFLLGCGLVGFGVWLFLGR